MAGAAGIPDPDDDKDEEAAVETVEFDDVHNGGDSNGEPPARKVERLAENTSTLARSAGQENGHPIPPARCSSSSAPNDSYAELCAVIGDDIALSTSHCVGCTPGVGAVHRGGDGTGGPALGGIGPALCRIPADPVPRQAQGSSLDRR